MKILTIAMLLICVGSSMEYEWVQQYQNFPFQRGVLYKKGSEKPFIVYWPPKLLEKYNNSWKQFRKKIDSYHTSKWKYLSERLQFNAPEVPTSVSSNAIHVARINETSRLDTSSELSTNSDNSVMNSQKLNQQKSLDATVFPPQSLSIDKFLELLKKERSVLNDDKFVQASSIATESDNINEVPLTYLLEEPSPNTSPVMLYLHRNKSESWPFKDTLNYVGPKQKTVSTNFPDLRRRNGQISHHRDTRAVSSAANSCHSRHLQKCGEPVIHKFKLDPDSATKCKIREDFLDCMVRQRKEGCFSSDDSHYSDENTQLLRSKIKSHLWSAHGCLLF